MASGISFLPGLDRDGAARKPALEPSVALLTWELPGGLLVADRLGDEGDVSYGKAYPPAGDTATAGCTVTGVAP